MRSAMTSDWKPRCDAMLERIPSRFADADPRVFGRIPPHDHDLVDVDAALWDRAKIVRPDDPGPAAQVRDVVADLCGRRTGAELLEGVDRDERRVPCDRLTVVGPDAARF